VTYHGKEGGRGMFYLTDLLIFFFAQGATAPSGPGPPHYRGFTTMLTHTTLSRTPLPSDQPDAETSTWQHTSTLIRTHPCPRRDSNPQSQQANGRWCTPWFCQLLVLYSVDGRRRKWAWSIGIKTPTGENEVLRKRHVTVALCPLHVTHGLA
jgi:hypothetical protein